jgi:2-oxoglutarate ferredoxin oxidoreductase subunit alpha
LRHIAPFPSNLAEIFSRFKKVLVPEINNGQLVRLLRDQYGIPAKGYNRVRGVPFTVEELKNAFINEVN